MPMAILKSDFDKAECILSPIWEGLRNQIVEAIAQERERCARLAEDHAEVASVIRGIDQ